MWYGQRMPDKFPPAGVFDLATAFGYVGTIFHADTTIFMAKKTAVSFEHSLQELEALVKKMDSGELSLEESLLAFEKGIGLVRQCQATLQEAEQKVQVLMERNGELHTEPFDADNNQ